MPNQINPVLSSVNPRKEAAGARKEPTIVVLDEIFLKRTRHMRDRLSPFKQCNDFIGDVILQSPADLTVVFYQCMPIIIKRLVLFITPLRFENILGEQDTGRMKVSSCTPWEQRI